MVSSTAKIINSYSPIFNGNLPFSGERSLADLLVCKLAEPYALEFLAIFRLAYRGDRAFLVVNFFGDIDVRSKSTLWQNLLLDGCLHGTIWLACVRAIAVMAALGKLIDFGEGG
jgi:hypothetical protein